MNQFITINTNSIVNLSDWKKENCPYLFGSEIDASGCTPDVSKNPGIQPTPNPNCKHDKAFFDLIKYFSKLGPSNWVQKNKQYICYEESRYAIEDVHTVNPKDSENTTALIDDKFKESNNKERVSVADLEKRGYNFDCTKYDQYMILELDNSRLSDAKFGPYDPKKYCFSFPFFKSILENNNVISKEDREKCYFHFVHATINKKIVLAFFVDFGNGKEPKHYDYSQNPPNLYRQAASRGNSWNQLEHVNKLSKKEILLFNDLVRQF